MDSSKSIEDFNVEKLRSLVKEVQGKVNLPKDLRALYDYYNIKKGTSFASRTIKEHIIAELRSLYVGCEDVLLSKFHKLKRQLIAEEILFEIDPEPCLSVVCMLRDHCRGIPKKPVSGTFSWERATRFALEYVAISPNTYNRPQEWETTIYSREYSVFTAVAKLRERYKDMEISVKDGDMEILEDDVKVIMKDIEEMIIKVGGLNVLKYLFVMLYSQGIYHSGWQRFLISRKVNTTGKSETQVPFGLIINLAIKHIRAHTEEINIEPSITEIVRLATDMMAALDFQPYSIWEYMFISLDQLRLTLREIAIYDSAFLIHQIAPDDSLHILRKIFAWADDHILQERLGTSLKKLALIHDTICSKAIQELRPGSMVPMPIVFTLSRLIEILGQVGISDETIVDDVRSYLELSTHIPPKPNNSFDSPLNYEESDYYFRPLIQLDDENYLLPHPSIGSIGIYEAVFEIVRNELYVDKHGDEMGKAFEEVVRDHLSNCGVSVDHGKIYGTDFEGDAIIQTPEFIVMIEMKTKVLTRSARSGVDINLFLDIANSLVKSQLQAFKIELELRKNESIQLTKNDGSVETISLNGRQVEKITLTLHDYGAFHDRVLISSLLNTFIEAKYSPIDKSNKEIAKKFDKLNKDLKTLRTVLSEIIEITGSDRIFFGCWFLCFSHLRIICKGVTSNEEFEANLKATRNITFQSLNFYYEYFLTQGLKKKN